MSYLKTITAVFLLVISVTGKSQNRQNEDSVYTFVDTMPEFPGGKEKMVKYVAQNLFMPVNCSKETLSSQLNSRITVIFIVNKEGQVSHVEFKEKISCIEFENQIRKIFDEMPDWTPGWHNGKPVHVKMTYPLIIDFK